MTRRELLRTAVAGAVAAGASRAIRTSLQAEAPADSAAVARAGVSASTHVRGERRASDGSLVERNVPEAFAGEAPAPRAGGFGGSFCLFSKHLPDLAWGDLARAVKAAGFDGIDLTVRPKGHVLPERVSEDLPRAVEAIQAAGSRVAMITTALASADDPAAGPTIAAAAKSGVPLIKPDYYRYQLTAPGSLAGAAQQRADAGRRLASLADLAGAHGVTLGYHNHTGLMGGPTLDFLPEIERLPAARVGIYYDVRHAVAEGGGIGWTLALAASLPRLRMISVKDLRWERDTASGRWRDLHVPMGEGMVDWPMFCRLLAAARWQGPVSVHLEFAIPGATPDERRARTLDAAARELTFIKRQFAEAYGA